MESLYGQKKSVLTSVPKRRPISMSHIPSIRFSMALRRVSTRIDANGQIIEKNSDKNSVSEKNLDINKDKNMTVISGKENENSTNKDGNLEKTVFFSLASMPPPTLQRFPSFLLSKKTKSVNGSVNGSVNENSVTSIFTKKNILPNLPIFSSQNTPQNTKKSHDGKMKLNYIGNIFDGSGIIHCVSTEGGKSTYSNPHTAGKVNVLCFMYLFDLSTHCMYLLGTLCIFIFIL